MSKKLSFVFLIVLSFVAINQGLTIIRAAENENDDSKVNQPETLDWQGVMKGLENGKMPPENFFDTSFYDIRSNETGLFNGSGSGDWNRFGYSTWLVRGKSANVSIYTIQKFDVTSPNVTLLRATYINGHLTGDKDNVHWNTTMKSRLMLRNGTLDILSNTLGNGTGYFLVTSNVTARYNVESTTKVNRTKDSKITTWHNENSGVFVVYEDFIGLYGFARGKSSNGDNVPVTKETTRQNLSPLDRAFGETFALADDPPNWAERYESKIMGEGKIRSFNLTSFTLFDPESHDKPFVESRNSSGFVWDNVNSLDMGLPDTFADVLPDIFRFIL